MKRISLCILVITAFFFSYAQQNDITSPAMFKDGQLSLNEYIANNTKYPVSALENNISGEINVIFTIDKNGNLIDFYTENSDVDESLKQEAIRVIKSTEGKWTPARKGNTKVNMIFSVPVTFAILNQGNTEPVPTKSEETVEEPAAKKKWWKFRR